MVGAHIDVARTELVDPLTRREFGYGIRREAHDHSAFAVIRGDAVVVVPAMNPILGPASLTATVACAVVLLAPARRWRKDDVRTSPAQG